MITRSIQKNFSCIEGKLFCDNCHEDTHHHQKLEVDGASSGKTYCDKCGNMTEYTYPLDGWLD